MVNHSTSLSTYIAYENNGVTLQPILHLDLLKDTYNTQYLWKFEENA